MGIRMSGIVSGLDTEAIVGALMSAQSLKKTKVTNAKTKLEWKQTKWQGLNSKLYSLYTGSVSKMRLQTSYQAKKATVSNSGVATVSASANAVNGSYTMEVKNIATSQYITGGKIKDKDGNKITLTSQKMSEISEDLVGKKIFVGDDEEGIEITESTTIAQFTAALTKKGINASFDTAQQRFFISSKESGEDNAFSLTSSDGASLAKLGLGEITIDANTKAATVDAHEVDSETEPIYESSTGMTFVAATDSKIVLNGATLTSSSSTVSANGLSISLSSVGKTTFSVATDVDGIYDSVKAALKEYNSVLEELNKAYSAESSRDYEPLTSEQKDAMSDDEVKEWEDKIKSGLLRSDSTLDSIIQSMKSAMQTQVEYNGRKYSLADLGIMTSTDWKEGGKYHIYGDSDDSVYADQTDKLKAALNNDPELVTTVLSGVFEQLRSNMNDRMAGTELSSALTFYNDIQMNTQLKNYKTEISEWDTRLQSLEDKYYSQFTAMEKAMAQMQSQQASLGSLLGG